MFMSKQSVWIFSFKIAALQHFLGYLSSHL